MIKMIPDLNNKRVFLQLKTLEKMTERSIRHGFFDLGQDLKRSANKEILRKPKGGRVYIVRSRSSGRRRRHVASAPGETHANMFGDLRRSLGWIVRGASQMEFGYGVDRDAPDHAPWVENGTKNMAARPSLKNAVEGSDRDGTDYFNRRFKDQL